MPMPTAIDSLLRRRSRRITLYADGSHLRRRATTRRCLMTAAFVATRALRFMPPLDYRMLSLDERQPADYAADAHAQPRCDEPHYATPLPRRVYDIAASDAAERAAREPLPRHLRAAFLPSSRHTSLIDYAIVTTPRLRLFL